MGVRADDNYVGLLVVYDSGDLATAVAITERSVAMVTHFFQGLPVLVQSFLIFAGFQIVAFPSEHLCGGAFNDVDQQVAALFAALAYRVCKQFLVMGAEIQCDGDMTKDRWDPVLQWIRLWMDKGGSLPHG